MEVLDTFHDEEVCYLNLLIIAAALILLFLFILVRVL